MSQSSNKAQMKGQADSDRLFWWSFSLSFQSERSNIPYMQLVRQQPTHLMIIVTVKQENIVCRAFAVLFYCFLSILWLHVLYYDLFRHVLNLEHLRKTRKSFHQEVLSLFFFLILEVFFSSYPFILLPKSSNDRIIMLIVTLSSALFLSLHLSVSFSRLLEEVLLTHSLWKWSHWRNPCNSLSHSFVFSYFLCLLSSSWPAGDKPHVCKVCDKRFALACNLRAHLKTHLGAVPSTASSSLSTHH